MTALVEVEDLTVTIGGPRREKRILRGVTFAIAAGQIHGLVGESGAGKSMTGRAISRLLPDNAKVGGSITFGGQDVLGLRGKALLDYRARSVATIFQDPSTHLNPLRRISDFMTESLTTMGGLRYREAVSRGCDLLVEVGVADPSRVMDQYPHQLSGGLLQRIMIGGALSLEPRLLIADEPTTALDTTTQTDVMGLLERLRRDHDMAVLLITHDLMLAASACDRIGVLYAGELLEHGGAEDIYHRPLSPYTRGLLASRPDVTTTTRRLPVIPGRPLSADDAPSGACSFVDRCGLVTPECRTGAIPLARAGDRLVRCIHADAEAVAQDRAPVSERTRT